MGELNAFALTGKHDGVIANNVASTNNRKTNVVIVASPGMTMPLPDGTLRPLPTCRLRHTLAGF